LELKNKNANHIGHLNAKTRIKILKELIADCRSFTCKFGGTVITNHWNINEVLKTFGNDLIVKSQKHYISEDSYKYGVSHEEVTRSNQSKNNNMTIAKETQLQTNGEL
jgi:hypothetical protein